MRYCPKCKYEYQPGVEICPDCSERLVYELPDELLEDEPDIYAGYSDWLPLARLNSLQYAEMVTEGLKNKNIPALLISETGHFGATGQFGIGSYRVVGGGYLIMVPMQFADDADREAELMLGDEWVKGRLERRPS
jgi:hypothetical protein